MMYNPNTQLNTNIVFVNSYQEACMYPIRIGYTLLMLDSKKNTMYIKSADSNGIADICTFKFEKVEISKDENSNMSKEYEDLKNYVDKLKDKIDNIANALGINDKEGDNLEQHTTDDEQTSTTSE